ncbi:Beta-galactosidase (Lactase) [Fusarium torreyae]|uniref:Beta-galactosidase (Lactase) n=1 Tax=Fusarium torreyae TaxID=1237075 RepID=A0A9W8VDF5_9HYPO|nr:Beta-galactosidase (Lactase) [Fusarium torreyae]
MIVNGRYTNPTRVKILRAVPPGWDRSSLLHLRFDGVDSAYHLRINGILVGYAQGFRNASEFDITEYVDWEGDNDISVMVYQWSDATYIEDQDQWWLSGIFRDVHLIAFPSTIYIRDWLIRTDLDDTFHDATLEADVKISELASGSVRLAIKGISHNKGTIIAKTELIVDPKSTRVEITLACGEALYTVHQNIGFRKVELMNGLLFINCKPIRLREVNRHAHHPYRGRSVPVDFIRRDLVLMEQHNINAIRCSHYPPRSKSLNLSARIVWTFLSSMVTITVRPSEVLKVFPHWLCQLRKSSKASHSLMANTRDEILPRPKNPEAATFGF